VRNSIHDARRAAGVCLTKQRTENLMRAAVVREHGSLDNILLEDDFPEPVLQPDWVRIAVRACSINYHDIFSRRGMPGIKLPLPLVIGSDIAGDVVEIGAGVTTAAVGDRVLIDPLLPAVGLIGERFNGGRAEFCAAHASQLVPIPDGVSYNVAASIPLAYATAHRMMVTRGAVKANDTVLVLGASGGVGTACVLLAKLVGATVIACASSAAKLERLATLGATHGIDYLKQNMRDAVWNLVGKPRISGSGGVDLVVNCTGGNTWLDSTRCMSVGARLVTCGATAGFDEQIDVRYVWTFEHTLLGSNGWRRSDITTLLEHAAAGTLVPVVDRVMPLAEVREAERLMEDREVFGKIVLVP
jgi:alcohol dehydrogenase